jgi:predicted permease
LAVRVQAEPMIPSAPRSEMPNRSDGQEHVVLETLSRLLPIVLGMVGGYLLRRRGAAEPRDGRFLFTVVFNICLPALLFTSLSRVDITGDLAVFPLAALLAMSAGYLAGRLVAAKTRWAPRQTAVLVSSCMIVNTAYALPFAQALYGADGVARIAAFDAVNGPLTFTFAYYTAARGNPGHRGRSELVDRLVKSPPLYGIAAGLLVNLAGVHVPAAIAGAIATFGSVTPMLIFLALGILFEPPDKDLRRVAVIVAMRLATGLAVAAAIVLIFGLQGVDRTVVLLLGVAPVAFNSVIFASLENLDVRLALDALSLSLVTSLIMSVGIILATM